jgi:16S rRNA (cytosine1402-N4)-methyltransferase
MLSEMVDALRPKSGGVYLDGTLGAGGYADSILRASSPDGVVIGLDLDRDAIARGLNRLEGYGKRFRAVHAGFHQAKEVLAVIGISGIDGAVLDLGLSSDQLEDPNRGFSFRFSGPLDMRFDITAGTSAEEYLMALSDTELEKTLATYGEEKYCRKLARAIRRSLERRELATTTDLARIVTRVLGPRRGGIHSATRTFQALRILVNNEMQNLSTALERIPPLLNKGARLCVVSYHSLEDRAVKHSFRERRKDVSRWSVVTAKPLRPTSEEIRNNPRARSARMRVLESLADPAGCSRTQGDGAN